MAARRPKTPKALDPEATGETGPQAEAPKAKARPGPKKPAKRARPAAAPDADAPPAAKDAAKRGGLLDAIAARSTMKRGDLRVVLELVLDEMNRALHEGRDLIVPPLGKIVVKRRNPSKNGDVLVSKIKLQPRGAEALAKPDEEG